MLKLYLDKIVCRLVYDNPVKEHELSILLN